MIDLDELKRRISYDPETGIFKRNIDTSWHAKKGNVIHSPEKDGYLRVGVCGYRYRAHRLAWFYHYGEWPEGEIDHINGIRYDNRISNLRVVSRSDNRMNCAKSSKNTSGFIGVTWDKSKSKWQASIQVGGKQIHIGRFVDINDAAEARRLAEIKYNFHENHGRDLLPWPTKYRKKRN